MANKNHDARGRFTTSGGARGSNPVPVAGSGTKGSGGGANKARNAAANAGAVPILGVTRAKPLKLANAAVLNSFLDRAIKLSKQGTKSKRKK